MKRILFPTDFSDNATKAIQYGLSMYGDEPCKITLLNTFYIPYVGSDVTMNDVTSENAEKLFKQLIEQISKDFPNNTFDIETDFRIGEISETASSIIERKKISLIVMGTQGANNFVEKVIGSRTSEVIRKVECPVLAVPEGCRFQNPDKIVFAVDNVKELSDVILKPLIEIVEKFKSEVLLLHVVGDVKKKPLNKEAISMYFKNVDHSYHTIYNENIPDGIEKFVKEQKANVLVLITHKLNLFKRIFHKSITKKMTFHSEIPLLALHIQKEDK
jgi:nucleotide-binding universal stress UspA family protein